MATCLEIISFKNCLPWYKRLFFPLFLNKEEKQVYQRLIAEEKSDLDHAKDGLYVAWEAWRDNPSFSNEKNYKWWLSIVEMLTKYEEFKN